MKFAVIKVKNIKTTFPPFSVRNIVDLIQFNTPQSSVILFVNCESAQ